MLESNGKRHSLNPKELLLYWIEERYKIRTLKEQGASAPWSEDPVFQTVYFTNVHREADKVTRWIRQNWSPHVDQPNYNFSMCMARLFNWPPTLAYLGFPIHWNPKATRDKLTELENMGKVWGNAYVVTTHGQRMNKLDYAVSVLTDAQKTLAGLPLPRTCSGAHTALQALEGFGSFMAAQVVADLKNTPEHPLADADDWWTFSAHGPGSLRGMSWFYGYKVTPSNYDDGIAHIRHFISDKLDGTIPTFCNQNLQNCLCEYSKYMRVRSGTGRSKRKYPGTA